LRPLGLLDVRGRDEPIAVFEPWPDDAPLAWRETFLKFHAMLDGNQAGAAALLQKLMAERPADRAIQNLAKRMLLPDAPVS
jgi:adenylate cyclase